MKTLKHTLVILFIVCISTSIYAQKKHTKNYDNGNLKQEGFIDNNGKLKFIKTFKNGYLVNTKF
jgi:antitoxin component YwqK of YwqJK toxin-antitoxin module